MVLPMGGELERDCSGAASTARAAARVLVVGLGGLGSPLAITLARAGVGTLGIVDDDAVDVTNLHRQILYGEADLGASKSVAAERALRAHAPGLRLERHDTRFLPRNAVELVARYDLCVEGSDNFPTKFLGADACAIARVPIVHGAAVRWHGTALAVGKDGAPCYRCLFEDLPGDLAPNCAELGVIGPVVGVVAALQADLALALIDGEPLAGTLVTFDGKSDAVRRRPVAARADCPLCGVPRAIHSIVEGRYLEVAACEV